MHRLSRPEHARMRGRDPLFFVSFQTLILIISFLRNRLLAELNRLPVMIFQANA